MAGIGDDLEEIGIAGSTADVLGWADSGAGDTGSGAGCGIDGDQAFEGDVVLPVVTKIVQVEEAWIGYATEVAEPNRGFVE